MGQGGPRVRWQGVAGPPPRTGTAKCLRLDTECITVRLWSQRRGVPTRLQVEATDPCGRVRVMGDSPQMARGRSRRSSCSWVAARMAAASRCADSTALGRHARVLGVGRTDHAESPADRAQHARAINHLVRQLVDASRSPGALLARRRDHAYPHGSLIWPQAIPPLMKLGISRCLPESINPRPR